MKRYTNVLALDVGLRNMGYAIGKVPNTITEWGVWHTYSNKHDFEKRKTILLDTIYSVVKKHNIDLVVLEMYRFYRSDRKYQHYTAELVGAIKEGLRLKRVEWEEINHNAWKSRIDRMAKAGYLFRLDKTWLKAINEGPEHSRDAACMLLIYVTDVKKLLMKEVVHESS